MTQLTDTQLAVLSSAAQRDDGAVMLPKNLKGGAAAKVLKPLLTKKLVKETQAKSDMPTWRRDKKAGQIFALIITPAGRKEINIAPAEPFGKPANADQQAGDSTSTKSHR